MRATSCTISVMVLTIKSARLETGRQNASDKSRRAKAVEFDTEFPSFCLALATGVGMMRLRSRVSMPKR